jgi:thiamine kinase
MDADTAIALLTAEGLLAPSDAPQVVALAGGYWNLVLRLKSASHDWVVKVFDQRPERRLFPILPDSEARAMTALAGLGLAPDPVAYFPETAARPAVLVYRFHEGEPWRSNTARVAQLLKRQHAMKPDGFRLLATEPDAILAQGDWLIRDIDDDFVLRLRTARPAVRPVPRPRLGFVHTDAGPGNLIEGPEGLRLIDWQCPGIGDPAEDLYSFLAPCFQILFQHAPLTEDECREFFAAYANDGIAGRLRAMEPSYAYRMLAYCCLRRYRLSGQDEIAAERYRRAIEAELPLLEAGIGSVPA